MIFTPRLTTAQFSYFAKEALLAAAKVKPLRTSWHGRLADAWSLKGQPVTYEEFACVTYIRRPGHLSSPEAWSEIKKMGEEMSGMLSAGWGMEQEHDPSISFHMQHDLRIADASVEAMAAAMSEMEKFIHAQIPGRRSPQKTGIGLFAILLFPDKINGFLFDVTVPDLNDHRSYGVDEGASKLGSGGNVMPVADYKKSGAGR